MAKRPYDTAAWRALRKHKLASEPFCEECEAEGRYRVATVVDHRVAISQGGDPFPELDGLASLCPRHHSAKTARSEEAGAIKRTRPRSACDASGNPLDRDHPWNIDPLMAAGKARARPANLRPLLCKTILVCGAPGSGKSTFARTMAMPGDVVLDLDEITATLADKPIYHAPRKWLAPALQARNRRLQQLANVRHDGRVILIVGAPTGKERQWWADTLRAAETIVLMPGKETCLNRVEADDRRGPAKARHIRAVHHWHARFTPRPGDRLIGPYIEEIDQ